MVKEPADSRSALRLLLLCPHQFGPAGSPSELGCLIASLLALDVRCRMDEPLPPSVGDGVARHELKLRSCYAEVLGSEPEYTSCHDAFW